MVIPKIEFDQLTINLRINRTERIYIDDERFTVDIYYGKESEAFVYIREINVHVKTNVFNRQFDIESAIAAYKVMNFTGSIYDIELIKEPNGTRYKLKYLGEVFTKRWKPSIKRAVNNLITKLNDRNKRGEHIQE